MCERAKKYNDDGISSNVGCKKFTIIENTRWILNFNNFKLILNILIIYIL